MMLIAGNWKMHGSRDSVKQLLQTIQAYQNNAVELLVLPPYIFMSDTQNILQDSKVSWGAQNLNAQEPGAYTGEIAATMLTDFGCRYVLVGHSERRQFYGESNTIVAEKFAQAIQHQLIPIVCVGETAQERNSNTTEAVILQQLEAVLSQVNCTRLSQDFVIAYEPIWAIGSGQSATPEQAQAVHQSIRQYLFKYGSNLAETTKILYGGSVKVDNAHSLFSMPDINGALVGGASLKAEDFLAIAAAAAAAIKK